MRYHKDQTYWTKQVPQGGHRLFWRNRAGEIQHVSQPFPSEREANSAGRAAIDREAAEKKQ